MSTSQQTLNSHTMSKDVNSHLSHFIAIAVFTVEDTEQDSKVLLALKRDRAQSLEQTHLGIAPA